MRDIVISTQFKKDYKRVQKRRYPLKKLEKVLNTLVRDKSLPERCRPHKLSGQYDDFWECHIAPDWLLIYEYTADTLVLRRTGTHADLFQ